MTKVLRLRKKPTKQQQQQKHLRHVTVTKSLVGRSVGQGTQLLSQHIKKSRLHFFLATSHINQKSIPSTEFRNNVTPRIMLKKTLKLLFGRIPNTFSISKKVRYTPWFEKKKFKRDYR